MYKLNVHLFVSLNCLFCSAKVNCAHFNNGENHFLNNLKTEHNSSQILNAKKADPIREEFIDKCFKNPTCMMNM